MFLLEHWNEKPANPYGIRLCGCASDNFDGNTMRERYDSMKNVRENEVEAYLRRQVEKLGGLCLKIPADYMRGIPDRIVLLPHGVLVWVETKRPSGGRVSGSQLVVHEMLRRLGQQVVIVWSKEDADELLHRLTG